MGDLHAPLGQNRPTARRSALRPTIASLAAGFAVIAILGISGLALWPDPAIERRDNPQPVAGSPSAGQSASTANAVSETGMLRSNPGSGARIERSTLEDGSVVTKYSPRPRDGNGPILIDAQRIGQDPRTAAFPNDNLLESTPSGRLPIIGPDGTRPMDQYARPWSGARGTRIAIVVTGLGLSQTGTQRALQSLPPVITLGFAATGNSLPRWMQEARRKGHEILLQVPFEPFDYPANDPGPRTLIAKNQPALNLKHLHQAMGEITNYTGVMNYLGGKFLPDANALEPVLRDIGKRGLLFLDDGSSAQSKTSVIANTLELPHAFGDVTLDNQLSREAILRKLDELERIASRKGYAIGIASAFDESVDAIRQWSEEASGRGFELVGIASIASETIKR